ncbi:MAG TPA: phosphatase PAP2 family protein [Cellvibrionaceae bacterium]
MNDKSRFILWHWVVPSLIACTGFVLIRYWALDERLAMYFSINSTWPYKDNWWLVKVVHNFGHKLAIIAYALLFIYWAVYCIKGVRVQAIGYALTSIAVSVLAVNVCKTLLHFPCPWDAADSLGQLIPYAWRPTVAGCFPSGHASSGYAWMCFYYVAYSQPICRRLLLATAIAVGVGFGIAQQIRGAHFLSHDWLCAYLCWIIASVLFFIWPKPQAASSSVGYSSFSSTAAVG